MQKIKVSIIIPVCDIADYLRRCLDSCVNQSLQETQIICINDCSPDDSLDILKEYMAKDERIKIIDFKQKQGVSFAKNCGMEFAEGEYIAFVEPKDYVELNFYEKLYKAAKEKNADIAKAAVKIINRENEIISSINNKIRMHKCYFTSQHSSAIYRSRMIKENSIKFPVNLIVNQDRVFLTRAVLAAKNVCLLDNVFYKDVKTENPAASDINLEKAYSALDSISLRLDLLENISNTDKHYFELYKDIFCEFFRLLSKSFDEGLIKKIIKLIIEYFYKCKTPENLGLPRAIYSAVKEMNRKKLLSLFLYYQYETPKTTSRHSNFRKNSRRKLCLCR